MLEASEWELETQVTAWLCQGQMFNLGEPNPAAKQGVDAEGLKKKHVWRLS